MGGMRAELSDDPTTFRTAGWNDLVVADPDGTFFQTPDYLKLWWEEFGAGRLVIASVSDDGGPAGACVFQIDAGLLTFLGGFDVTDYMGPVALPGAAPAVAEALIEAISSEAGWDRADLRGLKGSSPWIGLLRQAAEARGLHAEDGEDGICPILPLPGSYEEYLTALPAKLRHEIRRKERRLRQEFGGYRVSFATQDTLTEYYDRFIELHKQSTGPKGKFMHAGMEIFFRRLGEAFLPSHVFHLGFIEVAGTRAAGAIGFGFKDTFSLYNSAFDRDFAQWSPGMVLISDMIRRAIEGGRSTFDLLKGDLDYKYRFGAHPGPVARLAIDR
jgi:CelD/BcsL family acetyltransferase involved in cellulose biosynthesis